MSVDFAGSPTPTFASKFVEFRSQPLGAGEWLDALQYTGAGQIDEFFVLAPNTNFKVQITVDGVVVLERTYDELRDIEQSTRDISAFPELDEDGNATGDYLVSIRNIRFSTSIQVKVQNTGGTSTTLRNIFIKHSDRD
jgi:hypothetical protein